MVIPPYQLILNYFFNSNIMFHHNAIPNSLTYGQVASTACNYKQSYNKQSYTNIFIDEFSVGYISSRFTMSKAFHIESSDFDLIFPKKLTLSLAICKHTFLTPLPAIYKPLNFFVNLRGEKCSHFLRKLYFPHYQWSFLIIDHVHFLENCRD